MSKAFDPFLSWIASQFGCDGYALLNISNKDQIAVYCSSGFLLVT